ncbi:hypothetical protein ACFW04_013666 [Cataglyphis niger]
MWFPTNKLSGSSSGHQFSRLQGGGPDVDHDAWTVKPRLRARGCDWKLAASIVKPERVKWAVKTFKPFKSGLLQICGPFKRTLKVCLALGYIPKAWKLEKMVFISKVGKTCCTSAKYSRPISLTSFLLKMLEKLVEIYLKDMVLGRHQLHGNQHAYRMSFSIETAFHPLVSQIEKDLMEGGYAVGTFLDIKVAFNNTSHEV